MTAAAPLAAATLDDDFAKLQRCEMFAALTFDRRRLLVPQSDIEILEMYGEVQPCVVPGTLGVLPFQGGEWPVYCLDDDLRPTVRLGGGRRMCALLHSSAGAGYFGLACGEVTPWERGRLQLQPVPACMAGDAMLVAGLAMDGERPLCLSTGARLERWLKREDGDLYGD